MSNVYKDSPDYRMLRCPCCGKPMQEMYIDTSHYDLCFGDECIPDGHYLFRCKECKIKFDEKEGWEIPKGYKATITDKQRIYLDRLYNSFSNRLYDYDDRRKTVTFGRYVPGVISKEFAAKLIQEKLDERHDNELQRRKTKEYDELLRSHGVDPHYFYFCNNSLRRYGMPIDGGKIIFEVDIKTYVMNPKKIEIWVEDLDKFRECYNNKQSLIILSSIKSELIELKKIHDKYK